MGPRLPPDYLRLGAAIEELGRPTVLALTATASPPVRADVVARLGLRDPELVVQGFDRANIRLAVESFHDESSKRERLLDCVRHAPKPGLVYAATRRRAEEVAEALVAAGTAARAYHAGLAARERDEVQVALMADELDVVVATVAFGMGIDKPNVRWVYHHDPSDSVDSYYQEIGRAGRDGKPAEAVLFYRTEDLGLRRFFAGAGRIDAEAIEELAEAVADAGEPIGAEHLRAETGLSETNLAVALTRLEDAGALEIGASGEVAATELDEPAEAAEEAARAQANELEFERSRVDMMRGYAELRDCRREYLLNYFGEAYDAPCRACDNCEQGRVAADEDGERPFALGTRVEHDEWGEGLVQRYEDDKVVVLFDGVGYRTLLVTLVAERRLLRPLDG